MGRVYVYGIVDTTADQEVCGSVADLDRTSPVSIVAQGGIGCVISAYHGEALPAVSREIMLRYLLRHQQVMENIMQGRTVLPVKFGTTLDSAEEVVSLLAQTSHALSRALESVRDKVEVEVAATWDIKKVLQEVSREEEVVRAREAAAARGNPTLEEKMRLGQVVKACLDRRRDAYRERMLEYLQPLAVTVASNALVAEEMVMNVAFLVERARQKEFDGRVHALDSLFDNQVTFRVIEPLPPYSFSTVEITRLGEEQVEQARQQLGLPAVFPEAEVRRAYRHLAAREQQQAQSGRDVASKRLASLRRASEVLLAYCRARSDSARHLSTSAGQDWVFAISIKGTNYQEVEAARFGAAIPVIGVS